MKRNSTRDITQQRLLLSELPETERKLVITIMVRTKWATDNFLTVAGRIRENKQLHRGIAKRYLRECCTICENVQEWIKATAMHSAEWEAVQDACLALHREICGKSVYHVNLLKQLRDSLIDFSDTKHSEEIKSIFAEFGATNDILNFVIVMNALNIYDYRPITYMARMGGDMVFNIPNAQKSHSATFLAKFLLGVPKLSEELCKNAKMIEARRDMPYAMQILDRITKLLAGNECHIAQHYDAALADNADEGYNLTVNMEKKRRHLAEKRKAEECEMQSEKRRREVEARRKYEVLPEEIGTKYGIRNGETFDQYKLRVLGDADSVKDFDASSKATQIAYGQNDVQRFDTDYELLVKMEKYGKDFLAKKDKEKVNKAAMTVVLLYELKDVPVMKPRVLKVLASHGITKVGHITSMKSEDVKALNGIGPKAWENILEGLKFCGITIKQ